MMTNKELADILKKFRLEKCNKYPTCDDCPYSYYEEYKDYGDEPPNCTFEYVRDAINYEEKLIKRIEQKQ